MNPFYITGFTDAVGLGCFSVFFIRSNKKEQGWIIRLSFKLKLPVRYQELLGKIIDGLGVEGVKVNKSKHSCEIEITSLSVIMKTIIPHFDKYPLLTRTREDYELFKQVAIIMNKKQHLAEEGFQKILSLKAAMRNGLTGSLAENFPGVIPVVNIHSDLPLSSSYNLNPQNSEYLDPNWIVGFTEGKGSFNIEVKESHPGKSVKLNYQIIENEGDKELLTKIILYWNCGTLKTEGGSAPDSSTANKIFIVTNFDHISNIIIPFFQKFPLQGNKRLDFENFLKVAELIKTEDYEGLRKLWESQSSLITFTDSSVTGNKGDAGSLLPADITPVVIYTNAASQKKVIFRENVNKSGVYLWKNLITGETYIGSSQNLTRRFYQYFSDRFLKLHSSKDTYVSRALLKYGYSKFSLLILEYCDSNVILEREQYYLDLLLPLGLGEYNILNTAGSSKGYSHSSETILRMRGRKHTDESKAKMSAAKLGANNYRFGLPMSEDIKSKIGIKNGLAIKVTDLNSDTVQIFYSIRRAADFLCVDNSNLSKRIIKLNSFILKDRYKIEKLSS